MKQRQEIKAGQVWRCKQDGRVVQVLRAPIVFPNAYMEIWACDTTSKRTEVNAASFRKRYYKMRETLADYKVATAASRQAEAEASKSTRMEEA